MTASSNFKLVNQSCVRDPISESSLCIVQFNCNSISSKLSELKLYLFTKKPDVVCLCETWVQRRPPKFPGYQSTWLQRPDGQGGGLCTLVRSDIPFTIIDLAMYHDPLLEIQAVSVSSPIGLLPIVNVYNPCKSVSYCEFVHYVRQIEPLFIIVGDFNAHSPVWDERGRSNVAGRSVERLLEEGIVGLVSEPFVPTYVDRRSGSQSVLDLCLACNALLLKGKVECGPDLGSDHVPIVCSFGVELRKSSPSVPRKWIIERGDWTGWSRRLEESSLPLVVPSSVDELNDALCAAVVGVSQDSIPQTSGRRGVHRRTPWWDSGCAKAVALRRKARNALTKSPSLLNLISYKRACAVAKYTILQRKRASWEAFVGSLSPDTTLKKFWGAVRAIDGRSPTPPVVAVGGPDAPIGLKAEFLAEHFVKSLPCGDEARPCVVRDSVSSFSAESVVDSEYNSPIRLHEWQRCVSSGRHTSPGFDRVLNVFLQRLPPNMVHSFLYLFNASYYLGSVPSAWKLAIVCPIPKPNKNPLTVHAYRPISLLSCVGKLLERIIKSRLDHFLESTNAFSCFQAGFRRGRSTYDSLALLKQSISTALHSSSFCLIVYLDLDSAYDRVWRDAVLYKLSLLGCDMRTLLWLRSYLSGRCLRVRIGSVLSSCKPLLCGLPQGAVLSPLLFNVLLSDLPSSDRVQVISYADDISLTCVGPTLGDVVHCMQTYLDVLSTWLAQWKLVVSPSKSSYQLFTRKRFTLPLALRLSGQFLQHVCTQRVLGVRFDAPRLTFAPHIASLRADGLRRLQVMRALSHTRWGSSWLSLRRIYVSFVRSKLSYGSVVVFPCSKKLLGSLKTIENAALRCILGARKTTPIVSLEVEAYIWPFDLHVQVIFLKWYLRLLCGPGGAGELPSALGRHFLSRETFSAYGSGLLERLGSSFKPSSNCGLFSPVPPTFDLSSLVSCDAPDLSLVPPTLVTRVFSEFLSSEYPGRSTIYTDGSRLDTPSVSSAMYLSAVRRSVSWLLNPDHTVVGAELFAILQVLRFVRSDSLPTEEIVILSDSQCALQLIGDAHGASYRMFCFEIQALLLAFSPRVRLQWVPAHCGVLGNEIADRSAKLGHSNQLSVSTKLNYEEMVVKLRREALEEWRCRWRARVAALGKGEFLCGLLERPRFRVWSCLPSRRMSCVVSRLRMGHVGVLQHLYRFNISDSDLCTVCSTPETVQHFLLECSRYSRSRAALRLVLASLRVDCTLSNVLGCGGHSENVERRILRALTVFLTATGRVPNL